jgi:hypothetical protein
MPVGAAGCQNPNGSARNHWKEDVAMRVALIILTFLAGISAKPLWADWITNVVTWPNGPAVLTTGSQIRVEWSYQIQTPEGARIFALPMRGGGPAPGYAVSGSPFYRGQGSARAEFTLRTPGDIDAIRFRIVDEAQRLRHEEIVPIQFRFADDPLGGPALLQVIPHAVTEVQPLQPGRTLEMRPRDTVHPLVSVDAIRRIQAEDLLISPTPRLPEDIVLPGGEQVPMQNLMGPPQPYDASANATDWARQIERWVGFMSVMMMFDIERLLGNEAAFAQYRQQEEVETSTVFELLQYRRHAIGRLLDEL